MDEKQFDALVTRFASGSSRRDSVKALLAAALASVGVSSLAEARKGKGKGDGKDRKGKDHKGRDHKGKDKHHKGRGDKGKDHHGKSQAEGKHGQGQVDADCAQNFCVCPGANPAVCNGTTCLDCEYQGRICPKKRRLKENSSPNFRVSSGAAARHRRDHDNAPAGNDHAGPDDHAAPDDHDRGADLQRAVVYRGWQRQPEHLRAVRDELRLPLAEQHQQRLLHDGDGVRRHAMHHRHLTQRL